MNFKTESLTLCASIIAVTLQISSFLAANKRQNSERTNWRQTARLLWRKDQLESLPPPEAICPRATFCSVHCTCPLYPSVTVPCLSLLSSFCPPPYYHPLSVPSVSLSPSCSAFSNRPTSFICSTFLSLPLFYLLRFIPGERHKMGCSDPCCGIQNRVRMPPILWTFSHEIFLWPPLLLFPISPPEHPDSPLQGFIYMGARSTVSLYDAVFNFWT